MGRGLGSQVEAVLERNLALRGCLGGPQPQWAGQLGRGGAVCNPSGQKAPNVQSEHVHPHSTYSAAVCKFTG